jgi:hypothetical protein
MSKRLLRWRWMWYDGEILMKRKVLDGMLCLLVSAAVVGTTSCTTNDQVRGKSQPGSLFAKINVVTVLELLADRPIAQYRLVVNGTAQRENLTYENVSDHIYLAVVEDQFTDIHMKIGNYNYVMTAPNMGPDSQSQRTIEYMPSEKKICITNWTTIYGLTIKDLDHVTVKSLEVQIRGPQPTNPPYASPVPQVQKP